MPDLDRATVLLERNQLAAELRHWRRAAHQLADLELIAAPQAWTALESYLGRSVRNSLCAAARGVARQADELTVSVLRADSPAEVRGARRQLIALRRRYLRAETVLDFFGDAISSRSNTRLAELLSGLDLLAVDAMQRVLGPLGIQTPPVLCYLDKGLGASIMRAGVRLWDASLSPVAAIKITRHHLLKPTSMWHEIGHQATHLTGWGLELADVIHDTMAPLSPIAAHFWRSWTGEVAADVFAFAQLGYAPLPALANVVDGATAAVFRMIPGDPHPFGWLRVMFNAALCQSWFGRGPWDDIAAVWRSRHPLDAAPHDAAVIAAATLPQLSRLADACTRLPMRCFGGRSLAALTDPRRVAPDELNRWATAAGDSLYTSTYLARIEPMRIVAWTVLRTLPGSGEAEASRDFEVWLRRLGASVPAAA